MPAPPWLQSQEGPRLPPWRLAVCTSALSGPLAHACLQGLVSHEALANFEAAAGAPFVPYDGVQRFLYENQSVAGSTGKVVIVDEM